MAATRRQLTAYRLNHHAAYGSPPMDITPVKVLAAKVSADAKPVRLTLRELRPGKICELNARDSAPKTVAKCCIPLPITPWID
ncbi:MAG: hypothetical protein HY298_22175 [Verrucomicrobia bacterium]|nr:hypothetical protein [Verrucomicrobiota bacterium]